MLLTYKGLKLPKCLIVTFSPVALSSSFKVVSKSPIDHESKLQLKQHAGHADFHSENTICTIYMFLRLIFPGNTLFICNWIICSAINATCYSKIKESHLCTKYRNPIQLGHYNCIIALFIWMRQTVSTPSIYAGKTLLRGSICLQTMSILRLPYEYTRRTNNYFSRVNIM